MFLKFYHHLHPLFEVKSSFVHIIDEDNNLDIFEMEVSTNEFEKEVVSQELLNFINMKCMQNISNVFWSGGRNIKPCFQLLAFWLGEY
jgi:hypothetical protein